MERQVITGAAVGAVLGGMIAFGSKIIKNHRQEVNDLGHEWNNVKMDPQLTAALYNIKQFRHADKECYYKIGQACDNLVSLWIILHNPQVQPEAHWSYKSFNYRTKTEDHLRELADKVDTCKRPTKPRANKEKKVGFMDQFNRPEECSTNMEEFRNCADVLCTIVQNYDHNIRLIIPSKLTYYRDALEDNSL
jgi:hypothetical protein